MSHENYNNYIDFHSGLKGVPDVFINVKQRIQGISSIENVVMRLKEVLQPLLNEDCYFTIEPDIVKSNDEIQLSATIARLGYKYAKDILVKAVIIEKVDNNALTRVVRKTLYSNVIEHFEHGDEKEINFDPIPNTILQDWGSNLKVIYIITSEDELNIYQSIEVAING